MENEIKVLKVIVAGSRNFDDYETLKSVCDYIIGNPEIKVELISGNANGADKLGEKYAMEKKYELKIFKADWDKHGKKAGHIRNKEMGEYGNLLIAFWDGKSKGTKNMIDIAKKKGMSSMVYKF